MDIPRLIMSITAISAGVSDAGSTAAGRTASALAIKYVTPPTVTKTARLEDTTSATAALNESASIPSSDRVSIFDRIDTS
ncbi:MAG: hypothetical protein U0165_05505 [Polyangiaceae bacterium]